MFVPTTTQAGVYMFYLELKFEKYVIQSYRSVELAGGVQTGPLIEGLITWEEEPVGGRGALAGQAVRTGVELLRDYSVYWIAMVLTLSVVGLSIYLVHTRKPIPKNVDNLEVWVRKMVDLHATKEQFEAMITKQEYWTKEDLQRVFTRFGVEQELRERYHFTEIHLNAIKRFISTQQNLSVKKGIVLDRLQQQGLDKSVVKTLVNTYY